MNIMKEIAIIEKRVVSERSGVLLFSKYAAKTVSAEKSTEPTIRLYKMIFSFEGSLFFKRAELS